MKPKEIPYRVTLWKNGDVDYQHVLSDGFGIPAIVTSCPNGKKFKKYGGKDEDGERVKGIDFDECMECDYFQGLGFGDEIYCAHKTIEKLEHC